MSYQPYQAYMWEAAAWSFFTLVYCGFFYGLYCLVSELYGLM
jgi:hypothetical protein